MSQDTFELVYDGIAIQNGEMDVYALAPALIAMGDLFKAADAALNGSETIVTTSVKAEFREGSFEIVMSVDQTLRDAAIGIIPSLHLIGADRLIAIVVGEAWESAKEKVKEKAPEIVSGLFKLLGKLRGEKPKQIRHDESTETSIFVLGNNNTINVDSRTTELYENPKTLSAASRVALPLSREGITELKVRKKSKEIASLKRQDFPLVENALSLESSKRQGLSVQPSVQEIIVKLIKPSFSDAKWSVSDGGKPFSVSMQDENFKARVHAREVGFFAGDLYRVQMVTSQELKGDRILTARTIVQVLAPIVSNEQVSLPLLESSAETSASTLDSDSEA